MNQSPCQDCDCGRGQGRGCKLRQPRDLTKWERRVVLVLLVVLSWGLCAMLSGCQKAEATATQSAAQPYGVLVYRDRDTGCEYLSTYKDDGLTPRMGRDGKQICREVTK